MLKKINFKIAYASGEDEKCKAVELEYHGPSAQGWISGKNCLYPQQIILALENTVIVQQMQILGHHCFIPERIDIWIGVAESGVIDKDVSKQQYRYVGFISMKSNDDTQYKCRELKTITIPYAEPTKYIKLMLHQNYSNSLNIYDQVGIVAIQVMGKELLQESTSSGIDNVYPDTMTTSAIMFDDLAFEMYVDKDIARLLKMLHERKRSAVKDERFEYARKLKQAMEALQLAGETLGKLQIAKNQAIEQEDYSRAKRKKTQIDEFKLQVYNSLNIDELLEKDGILPHNDEEEKEVGQDFNNTEDGIKISNNHTTTTTDSGISSNSNNSSSNCTSNSDGCRSIDSTGGCVLINGVTTDNDKIVNNTKIIGSLPLQTFLVESHLQTSTNGNIADSRLTPCECVGSSARIWPTSPTRNK